MVASGDVGVFGDDVVRFTLDSGLLLIVLSANETWASKYTDYFASFLLSFDMKEKKNNNELMALMKEKHAVARFFLLLVLDVINLLI